jgi:hypothetical protein
MFALAVIEAGGSSHPNHPVAALTNPILVKGVSRYFTPLDAIVDGIAKVTLFASVFGSIALARLNRQVELEIPKSVECDSRE